MGNRFREKVVEEGLENDLLAADEGQRTVISGRRLAVGAQGGEERGKRKAERGETKREEEDFGRDEIEENTDRKPRKGDKVAKGVAKVLGGDVLSDRLVLRQIPLLLLCLFFLLLLVANRYKVESLSREKKATLGRINDLREQRIQLQKQYQESVKISQIAEELRESGVGITNGPPYEIKK